MTRASHAPSTGRMEFVVEEYVLSDAQGRPMLPRPIALFVVEAASAEAALRTFVTEHSMTLFGRIIYHRDEQSLSATARSEMKICSLRVRATATEK